MKVSSPELTLFQEARLQQEVPGTLSGTTSPIRTINSPSSPPKSITDRHQQWERLAQSADQKQAEAYNLQWNLIREQMSTFSSETILMHKELNNLKDEMNMTFDGVRIAREQTETTLRLLCNELRTALDIEVQQRTTDQREMEQGLGVLRATLELEKKTKAETERSLNSFAGDLRRIEERFRAECAAEARARQECEERFAQELQSTNTNSKISADNVLQKLEAGLESLRESLRKETAQRLADDEMRGAQAVEEYAKLARENQAAREKQARERRTADDALNERLVEITNCVAKERADREAIEFTIRSEMTALKQDITAQIPFQTINDLKISVEDEAKRRSDAHQMAITSIAKLESQLEAEGRERARIVPDLTDFLKLQTDSIDAELSLKRAAIAELQNGLQSLQASIETESKSRSDDQVLAEEELKRIRADLEGERTARKENLAQAAKDMQESFKSLSDKISKETQDRLSGDEEVTRGLQQSKQSFQEEVRARAAHDAEIAHRLQEFSATLVQDRADRDKGDAGLRMQVAEVRQEIETEKGERRDEAAQLGRSVRSVENDCASKVKELRAAFDVEAEKRNDEHKATTIEVSNLKTTLDAESNKFTRTASDLVDRLSTVSDSVTVEATERKNSYAEVKSLAREICEKIDQEILQRSKAFSDVQDAIKEESKHRTSGDESATRSLNVAVSRLEAIIESLREVLWEKMVNWSDRIISNGREWRDSPPALDFSLGASARRLAALDNGHALPQLENSST